MHNSYKKKFNISINSSDFQALEYYHQAYTPLKIIPRHMVPVAWHKPPEGVLKLNIDGSFEQNTTNGGTGGVIRDHFGKWITGFTCKIKAQNAHHAEILALLHGLNLATRLNLAHLQVETDSQVLLNNLNNNFRVYSHIYADCRAILKQMCVSNSSQKTKLFPL
ncbi:hypothetical protein R3W88_007785 [Solanum pinnatisectum]|uniref:RNase H type-1 domain-containing protein n=1 Tax=Solanum pinnatisectum TaxID=50273 RepID=A0AAV9M6P3_9SOLN|nr:hypothetical protein R3W88_007785 [Solanum pinnatisectum]